jgi:hypothetical protein
MKGKVLARRDVQDVLKGFVFAELWTDRESKPQDARNARLLEERFNTVALPFYATLSPDGRELSRLEGVASPEEFIAFLKKGQAALGSSPTGSK